MGHMGPNELLVLIKHTIIKISLNAYVTIPMDSYGLMQFQRKMSPLNINVAKYTGCHSRQTNNAKG